LYVDFDFDQQTEKMTANVQLPYLSYNGNMIDSLAFSLDSDHRELDFGLGFKSVDAGPLAIKRTSLAGNLRNNLVALDLASFHQEERIDRKSTRLNSSHVKISYAVFCLKKKNRN